MPRKIVAVALVVAAGTVALLAGATGWDWYLDGPQLLLALAAGYAAGAWLAPTPAVAGVLCAVAGLVVASQWQDQEYHWLDDVVFFLVIVGGSAGAGAAVKIRARQVRRLERLHAELSEQQRIEVAAARLDEQNRIQRDVHTRLAERIAGIAVRAEGALRSADEAALAAIETEARRVLDQLRSALGSLAPDRPGPAATSTRRDPPTRPTGLDVLLAAALAVVIAIETAVVPASRGPVWANVVGAALVTIPLVVRRTRPLLAVTASMLAGVLMSAWLTPIPVTVTGVALLTFVFYTVGAWCRGWWWVAGWCVAAAGMVAMEAVSGTPVDGDDGDSPLILLVWVVAAVAVGRVTAGWQERVRRTARVVAELEQGRGAAVRLALAQEREALASQLHDTVAHAMTVVCLQAAARQRGEGDRGDALQTIAATAATSLAELRDGLDAIESSEHPLEQSRIAALGRRVGIEVAVNSQGSAPTGPVAALAFRVVREGLVNVARHAPGAAAEVRLGHDDRGLSVEVLDAGTSSGGRFAEGTGTGLMGLGEAVAAAGGTLTWGPRSEGGFRVLAEIPEELP